jgi:hypothetical protein
VAGDSTIVSLSLARGGALEVRAHVVKYEDLEKITK